MDSLINNGGNVDLACRELIVKLIEDYVNYDKMVSLAKDGEFSLDCEFS